MNILILHALGEFSKARTTSINHAKCYEKYCREHRYVYHDVFAPVTPALKRIRFDAVILDTTFLCMRYCRPREIFDEIHEKYRFIRDTCAVRVAQPQDEYDHSEILDEWLTDYATDVIYSVCWSSRNTFYSKVKKSAAILPSLTGYIDDAAADLRPQWKPLAARGIDVGYRARKLPPQFGRYGQLKTQLGEKFLQAAQGRGLKLDISMRPEDVFLGRAWQEFLNDSKFTLGLEGGSSILDKRGEIRDRVADYLAEHPDASFEECERHCFPGEDRHLFSAISPRNFEVAAAGSAQILVPADYLGVLKPNEHYIALNADFSNSAEVFERMKDTAAVTRMIDACHEALLQPATYRYSTFARQVLGAIQERVTERKAHGTSAAEFETLLQEHVQESEKIKNQKPRVGWNDRLRQTLREILPEPIVSIIRRSRAALKSKRKTTTR